MFFFGKLFSNFKIKELGILKLITTLSFLQVFLFVFFIFNYEWNKFCDQQSLFLGLVLLLQTLFFSQLYKTFKRPFILYFSFLLQVFYSLRILTLYVFNYSNVLERFPYNAVDTNFALKFIIVANFFFFIGYFLNLKRSKNDEKRKNTKEVANITILKIENLLNFICILFLFSIFFQLSGFLAYFYNNSPRNLHFLSLFLTPNLFYVIIFPLVVFFYKKIPLFQNIFLIILFFIYIIFLTLGGSRSGVYGLLEISLISLLCFYVLEDKNLSRNNLYYLLFLTPLIFLALFFTFKVGTVARNAGNTITFTVALTNLNFQGFAQDLSAIFSRVGFFDFSSEIIAHKKYYSAIFNLKTYWHSLIDNVLTPGFDLFDQPKIGTSLTFVYNSLGTASKIKSSIPQFYQSDQIGIYGELYSLFGIFSLILFSILGFFIGFLEDYIFKTDGLIRLQLFTFFIFLFSRFFNSFGIDWFLIEIISFLPIFLAIIFIEIKYFKINS